MRGARRLYQEAGIFRLEVRSRTSLQPPLKGLVIDCEIAHDGGTFSSENAALNHQEMIAAFDLHDEDKFRECLLYDQECIEHFRRARALIAIDSGLGEDDVTL